MMKYMYEELLRPFVSVTSVRSLEVNIAAHAVKRRAEDNRERFKCQLSLSYMQCFADRCADAF